MMSVIRYVFVSMSILIFSQIHPKDAFFTTLWHVSCGMWLHLILKMLQDVSRLVDICRHSIYFDTIEGVALCLSHIHSDNDVAIERIKNRFDPTFDAKQSAGYRNLALNLRILTKETLALGVESHICEVQLQLVQIAAIKVSTVCHSPILAS
jgi:hypothetical protein